MDTNNYFVLTFIEDSEKYYLASDGGLVPSLLNAKVFTNLLTCLSKINLLVQTPEVKLSKSFRKSELENLESVSWKYDYVCSKPQLKIEMIDILTMTHCDSKMVQEEIIRYLMKNFRQSALDFIPPELMVKNVLED